MEAATEEVHSTQTNAHRLPLAEPPSRPIKVPGGAYIPCRDPGTYAARPIQEIDLDDSRARHTCWHWRRAQIWEALKATCTDPARLARFANCGACAWLQVTGDDLRIVAQHCGDRFCLPCQLARGQRLHRALSERMQLQRTRFATLTIRHRSVALVDQLRHLYDSFNRLRRSRTFKTFVTGGAAFLEVKLIEGTNEWHPHLHLLLAGDFFPQAELAAAWLQATGDSHIVDIRCIGSDDAAAKYVCKYVTKPAHFEVIARPEKLQELICALHGRRAYSTFGEWHSWPLEPAEKADRDWKFVAPLSHLHRPEYTRWREAVARRWPELAAVYGWQVPAPLADATDPSHAPARVTGPPGV